MTKVILDTIRNWGFFVIILFQAYISPGSDLQPTGARSLALSHASVSFSDLWSAFHNQAGLSGIGNLTGGVYYESRFGIDELSQVAGAAVVPAGKGAFALTAYQFGRGIYRENKYGLAYARRFNRVWNAGLQLDYFSQMLPGYDRARGFATLEAGILLNLSESLHAGIHVFNPVSAGYDAPPEKSRMPLVIRAGGHYSFDESVLIAAEVEKDNLNPFSVKSGIEFIPARNLALRVGLSGKPVKFTAGFGYSTDRFSADIGFAWHGSLGLTPGISVHFGL